MLDVRTAFIKSLNLSPFAAFGLTNHRGEAYTDMCGAIGEKPFSSKDPSCGSADGTCDFIVVEQNCVNDLGTMIVTYLVFTPVVQLVQTVLLPWIQVKIEQKKRRKRLDDQEDVQELQESVDINVVESDAQRELQDKVAKEMLLSRFAGLVDEFQPKVIKIPLHLA